VPVAPDVSEDRFLDSKNGIRQVASFVPGQPDIWVFVLFEGLVFSSYFVIYLLYRLGNPDLFLQSQAHLNQGFGAVNTLVLLISSWFMARCVQSAREKDYRSALINVSLTFACGVIFAISKMVEWSIKIHEGWYFSTNQFFWFYYFLTAIHVFHVLCGFVFLGVAVYQLRDPKLRSQEVVETVATYWHMVDFLWVIIFALLYVMR